MGRILSPEERLEITRRKFAFRETIKHNDEVSAVSGTERHQKPVVVDENRCPECGGEMEPWEGCQRCKKCGCSRC